MKLSEATFAVIRKLLHSSKFESDKLKTINMLKVLARIYDKLYLVSKPKGLCLIETNEFKLYIDSNDEGLAPFLIKWGEYEKNEIRVFKRIVKDGMTVIDVGANVGYYTLLASKLVGLKGRVYSFEPDPYNFTLLKKNVEINKCENVYIFNMAVSEKTGIVKLYRDSKNYGAHSLIKHVVKNPRDYISVGAVSLDDFFKGFESPIDVIKIDVQGSEGKVLRGMERIIRANKNLKMHIEFWPWALEKAGEPPKDFLITIRNYGFNIFLIDSSIIKLTDFENILRKRNNSHVNILCIKSTG